MKNWGWLLLLCLLKPIPIEGVEKIGVSVTPSFHEIRLTEGSAEATFKVTISNNTKVATTFDLSIVDFGSLDESGGVAFLTTNESQSEHKYGLASWVSLEKNSVVVEPDKNEDIKVVILNKNSLSPGGHYAAVMATLKNTDDNKADKVVLNQAVASMMYVLKEGGEIKNLKLNKFEIRKNWWGWPKEVQIRFENAGNVHVIPRGEVEIDFGSNKVNSGIVNGSAARILPESFRIYSTLVNYDKWWKWPGNYRLAVKWRISGDDNFETNDRQFIYFGYEGWLILVFLVGLTTFIYRKRFRL